MKKWLLLDVKYHFRLLMPKNPTKFGINLMRLTDAPNSYLLESYIHLGKDTVKCREEVSKPTQSVICLAAPVVDTNSNITVDNYEFPSIKRSHNWGRGNSYRLIH